jgi:hypothetical protein
MSMAEAGKLGGIASRPIIEKQKQERIEEYYKNPKFCLYCNKTLEYKNHNQKIFCNGSCSAKHNNRIRGYEAHKKLDDCIVCNSKIKKGGKKYCSLKCIQVDKWKERKIEIEKNNRVTGVKQARRYLLEIHGNKCAMPHCGISEWHGKPVLLICDHINGNSDDWSLQNLRMICSNCDAQTEFYKARNKGNGRHSRRMRYREGKSY